MKKYSKEKKRHTNQGHLIIEKAISQSPKALKASHQLIFSNYDHNTPRPKIFVSHC